MRMSPQPAHALTPVRIGVHSFVPSKTLLGRLSRLGDYPVEVAPTLVLDGYTATKNYINGLLNPWLVAPGSVVVNDPFSNIQLERDTIRQGFSIPVSNGTTAADGSVAFLLRGDTFQTIVMPASIDAAHAITWTGGAAYSTYGSYLSTWYNRPAMTMARVRLYVTGDPHEILANCYSVNGATTVTQIALGPTAANVGVSQALRDTRRGSSTELRGGQTIDLITHMARGSTDYFAFTTVGQDRSSSGFAGIFFWLYGLRSTDRVELSYGSHAEYALAGAGTPLKYPVQAEVTPINAELCQSAGESVTSTGRDVFVNTDDVLPQKVTAPAMSVVDKTEKADVLEEGVSAIADVIEGDYWGAIKHGWSAVRGLFSSDTYFTPRIIRLTGGKTITLPPLAVCIAAGSKIRGTVLPKDYEFCRDADASLVDALCQAANPQQLAKDTRDEEKKLESQQLRGSPRPLGDNPPQRRPRVDADEDPVVITPKSARRPSLGAMPMGGGR